MNPIHERLAELRVIEKKRRLTGKERIEKNHCLDANVTLCWKMAVLENCFAAAYQVMDIEWLRECTDKMNELEYGKKPGHNATDSW